MKYFVKSLIIFIFPIIIIGVSLEVFLRRIPNDYSYKKDYLDKYAKNIEVLFLGSSHMYCDINPEYIKSNSFNASHIKQSLNYDLEILKKYKENWDSLKYIIVAADCFSLYSKLEKDIQSWRVKNYNIYYNIYKNCNIANYSEILSNTFKTNMDRLNNFYIKGNSEITCSKLGWCACYSNAKNNKALLSGVNSAKQHTANNDLYFNENVENLKSIIEFAKEKKIKVILFTVPAYKTYVENLDRRMLKNTIKILTELSNLNSNTKYYNLLYDKSFTEKDFYDADHLNAIGAKKLTVKIDSFISDWEGDKYP